MSNDHIKSEISAYLAGGLPEVRNRQIEAHTAACEKCRQALNKARSKQARVKREALKKASPDPLPNLFLARQGKDVGVDRPASKSPWGILAVLVLAGASYGLYRHYAPAVHEVETPAVAADPSLPEVSTATAIGSTPPATAAVAAAAPASVPAPAPAAPPRPVALEVKQEWKGTDSGIKDSRIVVIRNEEAWDKLWSEMQQKEPLPAVPFNRQVVVCVFGGARAVGATIRLGKIVDRAEDVMIPYAISSALVVVSTTTMPPAETLSYPYLLSVIPRVEKKIRLTQREENL